MSNKIIVLFPNITNVLDEKNARRSAKRVTSEGGDDFYFGSD